MVAADAKVERCDGAWRCPLCPFRSFQAPYRVKDHIKKYHTEKTRYCPSGTRQLTIVQALHDNDQLTGTLTLAATPFPIS